MDRDGNITVNLELLVTQLEIQRNSALTELAQVKAYLNEVLPELESLREEVELLKNKAIETGD